jgi:general L-amino acid transport system permease protein
MKPRRLLPQLALLLVVGGLFALAFINARANLTARNIPTSFDFLGHIAGFGVTQSLIPYGPLDSYARALLVGLLNTLLVSVLASIFASLIGFAAGFARLSRNWALARLATLYVESFRNVPLLLHLLFWYVVLLSPLPPPSESFEFAGVFLNNRGLSLPGLTFAQGWPGLDWPVFDPAINRFNVEGGWRLAPEAAALVFGLSLYTGSYIAEIVRAGVQAVARGQSEAAAALGLSRGQIRKLVVLPQALRIVMPPLISQYLALTKNSSLAAFIGFADLMQVSGTILNQTGAALQTIAIDMALYLALSALTLLVVRLYERRFAWAAAR